MSDADGMRSGRACVGDGYGRAMQAEAMADVFGGIAVDVTQQRFDVRRFAFAKRRIERNAVELAGDGRADGDTDAELFQIV